MTKKSKNEKNNIITFRFGYKETIIDLTLFSALFTVGIALSVMFGIWMLTAILVILAIVLLIGLLADGAVYPVYISDRHVGFRGKKMLWKDIKITVCHSESSKRARYDLLIGTNYIKDKDKIKRQRKVLPCLYLKNEKILKDILPYYKSKIMVIDANGFEIVPEVAGPNKKINAIIIEHNSTVGK